MLAAMAKLFVFLPSSRSQLKLEQSTSVHVSPPARLLSNNLSVNKCSHPTINSRKTMPEPTEEKTIKEITYGEAQKVNIVKSP